jgi:TetR/AcrR family transcriptional regulator, transcriptional repressor for nem operon
MSIMARYSAEHKQKTRIRILAASERLLKRDGVDGASVEAVMRAAGLTVGGFYAHFASKDELAQQALLYGVEQSFARLTKGLESVDDPTFLRTLIARYLAQVDDPALEGACPFTVLLPEVARSDSTFRAEFAARTAKLVQTVEARFPGRAGLSRRETALAVFSALSGGVAMARAAATPRARQKIAHATQAFLFDALGLDAGTPESRPRPAAAER